MSAESDGRITGTDRAIAVAITPFVVVWDLFKNAVFRFFALLERLDPFSAAWRLLKKLAPWVARMWQAILPTLIRIRDFLERVVTRIGVLVSPITMRLAPVVDAAWRPIRRIVKPIYAALRTAAREVHRVAQPAVRAAARVWLVAAAPFKRVSAAVGRRVELVRSGVAQVLGRAER